MFYFTVFLLILRWPPGSYGAATGLLLFVLVRLHLLRSLCLPSIYDVYPTELSVPLKSLNKGFQVL